MEKKDARLRRVLTAEVVVVGGVTYGVPRIHQQLRQDDVHTSRKRVAQLMAEERLVGHQRRRFKKTTIPDATASPVTTDLVGRNFKPANHQLNGVWVGDTTSIHT